MDTDLYRLEEVAQVLRVGRSKVYELVQTGELPVVRIGRSVRVPRAALADWVLQHTEPWTSGPALHGSSSVDGDPKPTAMAASPSGR